MPAPFEVVSSDNTITVTWRRLIGAETGYSDILSYNLYWDGGSGADLNIELCDGMLTQFTVAGLVGGTSYSFKVRAQNIYDYGDFSNVFSLVASDLPGKPIIPVVTLTGTDVIVAWVQPSPHDASIDVYEILFKMADHTWTANLVSCDGSNPLVVSGKRCAVPMLDIKPLTGLVVNDLISVKVRAHNADGWGAYSEPNIEGQVVESLPLEISPVTIDFVDVTNTQIIMRWRDAPMSTQTGGDNVQITHYEIAYAVANSIEFNYLDMVAFGTKDYTHSALIAGTDYSYKIRAINKYGASETFSTVTTIQTGQAPQVVPSLKVEISDIYVRIEWVAPFDNHLPILSYQVLLKESDSTFVEHPELCNGGTEVATAQTFCTIHMHVFWAPPFSMGVGEYIYAKVIAINERGSSTTSLQNANGAKVQVVPDKMLAPTRGADTDAFQVHMDWLAPFNGDSPIQSYELSLQDGQVWNAILGTD